MARDILDTKRLVLEDLERSESEAQRLESALNRVRQLDLERSKESSKTSDPNSATSHVIGSLGPVPRPRPRSSRWWRLSTCPRCPHALQSRQISLSCPTIMSPVSGFLQLNQSTNLLMNTSSNSRSR
ncbi:hypothetical protein PCANC_01550 [Puccinia coronata f. sp. avenae]|uniref:Uncharacterized protein n=1 Tax=Puccinia coronata f. sp. avenae TaxID=200324 RepID=A0A2N5W0K3_9BASI|nr:hypothetical protein PCANC_09022 [Puccinia coronata f. sp. avenae]PLW33012.1 hypothetical protein PCASD_14908 [Puccinia coronata f. sp. avenae]PLW55789.1 hypothetical protein PCANC_01550 [Puccinia coronata f. sp. avenae]